MEGRGPDTYDVTAGCDVCDGSGTLEHAYEKASKQRDDLAAQLQAIRMKQYLGAALPVGDLTQPDELETIIDAYVDNYTCEFDNFSHSPSKFEQHLIKDAMLGLLTDDDWDKAWGAHIDHLAAAKAQPAQGLTDAKIRAWWASENKLEDCDMCKLDDFTTVVRAVESRLAIQKGQP